MRVLLLCQQSSAVYSVPAYSFWATYFRSALAEAGHEVLERDDADWARGLRSLPREELATWRAREWERTLAHAQREHARAPIQLALSYFFPQQVEPSGISQLQAWGIPCVNFFCDNVREFTYVPDSFRPFALHWVPEAAAKALYQRAKYPFLYAPMPVWLPAERRLPPVNETNEVSFVGSHDVLRETLLAAAVSQGLDVQIYGAGWRPEAGDNSTQVPPSRVGNQLEFIRRYGFRGYVMKLTYKARASVTLPAEALHAPIYGESYFAKLQHSAVTVGINRYPGFHHSFAHPGTYSRLRDIEAPMLGACYLTENTEGLADLYDLGQEVETYTNADELVEKARALLADPTRRRSLRARGQQRALRDHSIASTLKRVANHLGIA